VTEQELRTEWQKEAREQTLDTLPAFLAKLAAYPHNYGTIVVALGAGAVATARALDRTPNGGITGFQAGGVMWEFIQGWDANMAGDNPQRLVNYGDLLYPQYATKFTSISPETWDWAQQEAKRHLQEEEFAHPKVREHWESIAGGNIPFGLSVEAG